MVLLNEGGLSRTYQMMNDPKKVFAIISAERQDKSKKENKERTKSLIQDVTDLGYGFTHMAGGYWEEGQLKPGYEHSLFIPNIKKEEALELGGKYNQDTILYKDETGMKYYKPNGEVDSEFSTDELTVDDNFQLDKVKPYFSRRLKGGNQRNAFSFKPKEESLCLFAYEPYTGMGKHRAYLNAVSESDYITDYTRPPKEWYKKTIGEKYMRKRVNEMYDEYGNHITPEEYAKGVADGTINEENGKKYPNVEAWLKAKGWNVRRLAASINYWGSTGVFAGEILEDEVEHVEDPDYPELGIEDLVSQIETIFSKAGYVEVDTGKWVEEDIDEMYDEYGNHITPEEYAKGVADGTINESENGYKYLAVDKSNMPRLTKYLSGFDKDMSGEDIRMYVFGTDKPSNDFEIMTGEEYVDDEPMWYDDMNKVKEFDKEIDRFRNEHIFKSESKNEMYDEYGNHITPEEYAKGVADGTINESENTNKEGAYINRAEGKYAVHAKKHGGAIKYTSSLDAAYNYLTKNFGIDRKDVEYIKESVEDETDDNMLALEDYLVSAEGEDPNEVEIKSGYTDNLYDTPWGEYYVFGSYEEAEQAAIEYEKQVLDDIGIDALNWDYMPYEIGHYVDRDWFQEAMEESNQFYIDDMSDKEKYDNYIKDLIDEDYFVDDWKQELLDLGYTEEEIGDFDAYSAIEVLDMFNDWDEEILEKLNNNYADPIEWYKDNFGEKDFSRTALENNLVDLDEVAEDVVETDGVAHALAGYDGNEIEWEFNGKDYYIYKNS